MFKWSRVARMNGATENGFIRPTRVPYKVLYALLFTTVVVLTALLLPSDFRRRPMGDPNLLIIEEEFALYSYNRTYPLTPPTRKKSLAFIGGSNLSICHSIDNIHCHIIYGRSG